MAVFTYGTFVDAAQYFEDDDGVSNPPPRPTTGGTLKVQDLNGSPLPDQTYAGRTGYFSFTLTDIPACQISADNGVTWTTLISIEAQVLAEQAGANALTALQTATAAVATANAAAQAVNQGNVTFLKKDGTPAATGRQFSLSQILARSTEDSITPAETQGFALVAESGAGADLLDYGQSGGVAAIDQSGFVVNADGSRPGGTGGGNSGEVVIPQNSDGTFPARNIYTTDPRVSAVYIPWYDITKKPTIGVDLATAFAVDASQNIPGDRLRNLQAAVAP